MRSSGSTPSPRARGPIALWLVVVGDDHPRACTGRRLIERGLVRRIPTQRILRPAPVALDPFAREPLSAADLGAAREGGVLGIDCSWNALSAQGGFRPIATLATRGTRRRRLPFLIAANPQHYGRLGELNTAEAFAAALDVLGSTGEAAGLLEGFAGGVSFLELNAARLSAYRACADGTAVRAAERALFSAG